MSNQVVIIAVEHQNGQVALVGNQVLFEVVEGGKPGTRGTDTYIHDTFGPIRWDRTRVSVYETGEIKAKVAL